jgi:beta-carotene hydroxylase
MSGFDTRRVLFDEERVGRRSMRLRNTADYQTVLWVALAVAIVAMQYAWPQTVVYASPFSCYLAIACGVIAHNHNHRPTFVGRRANNFFGHVLTVFYGYPTLLWIPTHNLNHHRFVNRPGDATITWRYTNRHNLFVALSYFFVSSYFQSEPIKRYLRRAKLTNRHLYGRIMFQYAFWLSFFALMFGLSVLLHYPQRLGFYVWFFSLALPAFCSVSVIMLFNYVQHVHADVWSESNHSRNFTSKLFNLFFFNNGFHTAHHDHPGLHWSELPDAHGKMALTIDPRLIERSLVWYVIRQYLLAPIFPALGTRQLGAKPWERPVRGPMNEEMPEQDFASHYRQSPETTTAAQ